MNSPHGFDVGLVERCIDAGIAVGGALARGENERTDYARVCLETLATVVHGTRLRAWVDVVRVRVRRNARPYADAVAHGVEEGIYQSTRAEVTA